MQRTNPAHANEARRRVATRLAPMAAVVTVAVLLAGCNSTTAVTQNQPLQSRYGPVRTMGGTGTLMSSPGTVRTRPQHQPSPMYHSPW